MSGAPRNTRWLYLLAIFQLVAGPLVLTQVMVFCKLTAEKAPQQGLVAAAAETMLSAEFAESLDEAVRATQQKHDGKTPGREKPQDVKIIGTTWSATAGLVAFAPVELEYTAHEVCWTPQGLHAPPGQPPRLA